MARYYFHLVDGSDTLLDTEGRELDGAYAIAEAALAEARGILSAEVRTGELRLDQTLEIVDAARGVVHRLRFIDAVKVRWPDRR